MRNLLTFFLAGCIALFMVACPLWYKHCQDLDYRHFRVVEEGVLYRSGQLPLPRLQQVVAEHHIRTIVCLREGEKPDDQQEEAWVRAKALNFVRIPPLSWQPDASGKVPSEVNLQLFRDVMDRPENYPVLVHCFAGIHRTGMMCALFRMDYQGWSNDEAMAEMRVHGYTLLDDHEDIHHYFEHYRSPATARTRSIALIPAARGSYRGVTKFSWGTWGP